MPLALLVAALLGALAAPAPSPAARPRCPGADRTPAAQGPARAEAAVLCLVNHERRAAGLRAVRRDADLRRAARRHAGDMAARGFFAHDAPSPAPFGTDLTDRVEAAGYRWSALGENIAAGQPTPRAVLRAWLDSAGHCRNLLSPAFTELGVGVDTRGPGAYAGPTWVQDFGRPRASAAPADRRARCPRRPARPAARG